MGLQSNLSVATTSGPANVKEVVSLWRSKLMVPSLIGTQQSDLLVRRSDYRVVSGDAWGGGGLNAGCPDWTFGFQGQGRSRNSRGFSYAMGSDSIFLY